MEDDTVIIRKMTEADAEKCGFEKKYTDIYEDWGFADLILIDIYIIKREN